MSSYKIILNILNILKHLILFDLFKNSYIIPFQALNFNSDTVFWFLPLKM